MKSEKKAGCRVLYPALPRVALGTLRWRFQFCVGGSSFALEVPVLRWRFQFGTSGCASSAFSSFAPKVPVLLCFVSLVFRPWSEPGYQWSRVLYDAVCADDAAAVRACLTRGDVMALCSEDRRARAFEADCSLLDAAIIMNANEVATDLVRQLADAGAETSTASTASSGAWLLERAAFMDVDGAGVPQHTGRRHTPDQALEQLQARRLLGAFGA